MDYQSKILIIEDDQRLAKTIANVLRQSNYDVCCAYNGAVGIQKSFEYGPDLILCDIRMSPIDGHQVYNVLKESSLIDQIPFIFITGNSDLSEIRLGLDLGADDYFVKPFDNDRLIKSVENRLAKYKKLKDIGKKEFKALFKLSPNPIFLFDGQVIFDGNPAFIHLLGISHEKITKMNLHDFIDQESLSVIKNKLELCTKGLLETFSEKINLNTIDRKNAHRSLFVSTYEKFSGYSLMIGLITIIDTSDAQTNEVVAYDLLKLLKREQIAVTPRLEEKLTAVFKKHDIKTELKDNSFFSQREYEVLCLSMEGLSIKTIADKLYISDRTVEKHRANLMEKTNSNNMIEVIIYALRNNLVRM
ncbi:MAG: response regulator [Prolixibacteraceae bacterium]|nr:response regulator [Prolixibacteraceae bacterium]